MATIEDLPPFAAEVWRRKLPGDSIVLRHGRSRRDAERAGAMVARIGPDGRKGPDESREIDELYDDGPDLGDALVQAVRGATEPGQNVYVYAYHQGSSVPYNTLAIVEPEAEEPPPKKNAATAEGQQLVSMSEVVRRVSGDLATQLRSAYADLRSANDENQSLRIENQELRAEIRGLKTSVDLPKVINQLPEDVRQRGMAFLDRMIEVLPEAARPLLEAAGGTPTAPEDAASVCAAAVALCAADPAGAGQVVAVLLAELGTTEAGARVVLEHDGYRAQIRAAVATLNPTEPAPPVENAA